MSIKQIQLIMNLRTGFTLIELLVVIAIIGMLSSVVLSSLNSARGKGADATVKATFNNLRAQAQLLFTNNNGSFSGICTGGDATIQKMIDAASVAGTGATGNISCYTGGGTSFTSFTIYAPLKTQNVVSGSSGTDYWCIDSVGTAKIEDVTQSGGGGCQ